ncbi:activity-regulated cytoskeleton associated protein 2-like [Ctenocephalides felis]|uniref:activity-regulated cytoskeleton associated protein 2-like n=1 Tax=Ctenocephalides felis TaxID=7515 RepID=UPI000E6E3D30|nr:activity-regulated cytoskeleton associated protein 2-like [Ctenocephalides felis]
MTEDMLGKLIGSVMAQANTEPTPKSFSTCSKKFDGSRDPEALKAFISHILLYKSMANISDQKALQELPLLLQDAAATWWAGIKSGVQSFDEAIRLMKLFFGTRRPAPEVYLEFFNDYQNENTSTDWFVVRKKILLAELPYEVPLTMQIDMVYGLLHKQIRDVIPRADVNSFEDLVKKSKDVELSILRSKEQLLDAPEPEPECTFCNKKRHTAAECRSRLKWLAKKNSKINQQESKKSSSSENQNSTTQKTQTFCFYCEEFHSTDFCLVNFVRTAEVIPWVEPQTSSEAKKEPKKKTK